MDKREALELYLKLHEECVRSGCKDCIFKEPYNDRKICILLFAYNNSVAEGVKAKLKDMKEKQEESSVQSEKIKETTTLYLKAPISADEFEKQLKELLPQKLALEPLPEQDNINHPKHYCKSGLECIDVIRAAVSNLPPFEAVCVANIIKYAWRYKDKNGLEDVKKAAKYLQLLQEEMKKNG